MPDTDPHVLSAAVAGGIPRKRTARIVISTFSITVLSRVRGLSILELFKDDPDKWLEHMLRFILEWFAKYLKPEA